MDSQHSTDATPPTTQKTLRMSPEEIKASRKRKGEAIDAAMLYNLNHHTPPKTVQNPRSGK